MSEKTVWPDWKRKYDGLPKISDYNKEKNIYVYDGDKAWLSKFNIADIERCHIINWAKASDGSDKIFPEIATPEECEARKKEIINSGMNFINSDFGEEKVKHFPNGKPDDNPWIPGNEPEEEGWKEITSINQGLVVRYYNGKEFYSYKSCTGEKWLKSDIIAYKAIILSPPYVPPDPERKMRCPFCNAKFQSIELACDDYYFQCCVCRGSLPPKETKQEARQFLFEIYDKLNK